VRRLLFCLIAMLALAPPAAAQPVITSSAPDTVSITETRTVRLPAGHATIRFEGVAGNIFAETVIVAGLPQDVREKNLDADLLSPRSLYDRALGRRVMIRRTNPATGRVTEEQAIIRSGADGAAVLQTGGGYEDLRCSGLPQTLVYDGVPNGLSPKPTLSIETDSATAKSLTLTLSYLAGGFDWQADYVVQMRPDGRGADLFGWITLASSDVTSFAAAGTQVVAGKPNRTADWNNFGKYSAARLTLKCWPMPDYGGLYPTPPPPPAPMAMMAPPPPGENAEDIVVTGSHVARQEELGDFKLYRIPDVVTVASKAQKQVALLSKQAVPLRAVYVSDIVGGDNEAAVLTLRARNRVADGLGLPLPAGRAAIFEQAGGRSILVGDSTTDDKAVGEYVEFKLAATPQVSAEIDELESKGRTSLYELVVTNANSWPIAYEAKIASSSGAAIKGVGTALGKRDGKMLWTTTIPANGAARMRYRIKEAREN
jgi:hypothetical protein